MKKTNILYWVFTILFAGFMIFSAIPDALNTEDAKKIVHDFLGYPVYFIPFLGVAKLLGAVTILIPGLKTLKEWAYAGLAFDLIAATYSSIAMGATFAQWSFMFLPLLVGALSYIYHHKKMRLATAA
jgi:DoxX-like family